MKYARILNNKVIKIVDVQLKDVFTKLSFKLLKNVNIDNLNPQPEVGDNYNHQTGQFSKGE